MKGSLNATRILHRLGKRNLPVSSQCTVGQLMQNTVVPYFCTWKVSVDDTIQYVTTVLTNGSETVLQLGSDGTIQRGWYRLELVGMKAMQLSRCWLVYIVQYIKSGCWHSAFGECVTCR